MSHVAGVRKSTSTGTSGQPEGTLLAMHDGAWSVVGSTASAAAAPRAVLDRYTLHALPAPAGRVAALGGHQQCEAPLSSAPSAPGEQGGCGPGNPHDAKLPSIADLLLPTWRPAGSAGTNAAGDAATLLQPLRILTYNIWNVNAHLDVNYTTRIAALAAQVRALLREMRRCHKL